MSEINEKLQKFNPSLVGSQITGDHLKDEFRSQMSAGKMRNFNDDTRSMISMSSNLTGLSRKTGISMLDVESISQMGEQKKMPGDKGLQANAKRRMEKA